MADNDDAVSEPDLGALVGRLVPRLIALEEPILRTAGLSMWEYAIVSEVAATAALSQRELSQRTGRDPTRLGRHLDELQERDIVSRERSGNHRQWSVSVTEHGRELHARVRSEIRSVEDELLRGAMSDSQAATFRQLLRQLVAAVS
ncbi:MarR family winged helix-turn-helix transcriptional regulator [Gordonia sp. 'Campus']|uniref:MarR family winged helix-turn-helix transcriptional regulator n=1 Tax=Gordonia sp. 'Campus' TaxID=2915824 RepID=UPI001EE4BE8B|nr:MarR family winged helix-turn-helix transcriptional regulator [Gordonia sp. 'Campus']